MAVDPTGKPESYTADSPVELILLTDIHPDHLDAGLLSRLKNDRTVVIGPAAVINKLGYGTVLTNGARTEVLGLVIEAIPAYNTTQGRLDFHPKGRGNGYVLTTPRGIRVYISGDTEDTSEMRALKDIDFALVCMNLPYTMTPEQAAAAVKEFKPRTAIPYHYRQMGGVSDIMSFRKSVEEAGSTKVVLLKWY
jgi:L-ascorbate metabolism protein UlaG (beta-lactamase superfamily)